MQVNTRRRMILPALISALALAGAVVPAQSTSAQPERVAATPHYITVTNAQATAWVRNFNPFSASGLESNSGGVYEPLMIITHVSGGRTYPWLATSYKWLNGYRGLIVTLRHGVKWSDGVPFTAKDVVFTFRYGKKYAVADQNGLWASGFLRSVSAAGPDQVVVRFTTVDTTSLPFVLSNVRILPEHIWSHVTNPATWTNPNPVGTGPFTRVVKFTSQEYILGRNPYYWQQGKPAADGLRVPLFTGNDPANLATVHGDVDWSGNFLPNIQKVYAQRDPVHNHYDYSSDNAPNGLFFNDQVYPFSLVGFRKALSYAIDRTKVWLVGEYGYEPPADAIGLSHEWPSWVDKSLMPQARQVTSYKPPQARALLAKLGFTWRGGQLYDPQGHKVSIQLAVIGGWTDWVLVCQILQKNFQAIGIDASIKIMDEAGWTDKADKGLLSAHLHWTNGGLTPYYYFYGYMSRQSYVPTGQDASSNGQTNWERWWSPEATQLLAQFRHTTDAGTQRAIVDRLQKIQLDAFPYIPVMYAPTWYIYSTRRFTGWPTPSNYYAVGSPGNYPDDLKIMTTVVPVK